MKSLLLRLLFLIESLEKYQGWLEDRKKIIPANSEYKKVCDKEIKVFERMIRIIEIKIEEVKSEILKLWHE
jgi:hypothetical protein